MEWHVIKANSFGVLCLCEKSYYLGALFMKHILHVFCVCGTFSHCFECVRVCGGAQSLSLVCRVCVCGGSTFSRCAVCVWEKYSLGVLCVCGGGGGILPVICVCVWMAIIPSDVFVCGCTFSQVICVSLKEAHSLVVLSVCWRGKSTRCLCVRLVKDILSLCGWVWKSTFSSRGRHILLICVKESSPVLLCVLPFWLTPFLLEIFVGI